MKLRWYHHYQPYIHDNGTEQPSWQLPVLQFLNDNGEWEEVPHFSSTSDGKIINDNEWSG